MGASGAGKTTVGALLAAALGWSFLDGDTLHPRANIEKMRRGSPLTDQDRAPWLHELRLCIETYVENHRGAVVACSALRRSYREQLRTHPTEVRFVYLEGSYALLRTRLETRQHHFMNPALLRSQLELLEEPTEALVVDAGLLPGEIVQRIRSAFGI